MAKGIYNNTYFVNHPDEASKDAVLYCVILVHKASMTRECIKIGIAKGRNWKDVIKRSGGFRGYEIRIQKVVHGPLQEIFNLEQELHLKWKHLRVSPTSKFGGHTECFQINDEIIKSVPSSLPKNSS